MSGVTADDGAEDGPRPFVFCAFTVKVYAVPFVSPVTVQVGCVLRDVHVLPVGVEVT